MVRVNDEADGALGGRPAERADAARNRRRILDAAARLIADEGVDALSVHAVAEAAGVGVGTLYRRFGDRAGLARALLDDRERRLQESLLRGAPPLGPGAPPSERIRAFLHALADRTDEQIGLLLMAEMNAAEDRFGGAYAVHHAHLSMLIVQARPGADAPYLADALLAPFAANLFTHQRAAMSLDRIKRGLDQLLEGLAPTPSAEGHRR
ncbi:helix-turn-helix domain-containing protein [Actinocorallia libanotica]|uniref:TetR/AcrR family transcriptional regulator n=1 Tax=Actinocorallia libanotica TaxID=46162 RepID=A0ABP4CQ86_9ACTN